MDANTLREALRKQPFKPFVIRLADGRQFDVPHPDFVAVSQRTVVVISPQTEGVSVLEPLLIISLEMAGGDAQAKSQA